MVVLVSSNFSILYSSGSFFGWSSLFVVSGVDFAAGSSREIWNTGCNLDSLGSCSLKLTGPIFSNISYGLSFLKSNLVFGRFVLMCLRSRYILFSFFSGGLILRFLLLYCAVFNLENSISLDSCLCSPCSLLARTMDC